MITKKKSSYKLPKKYLKRNVKYKRQKGYKESLFFKILWIILSIALILIISITLFIAIESVFFPAYLSVVSVCDADANETLAKYNRVVAGNIILEPTNETNEEGDQVTNVTITFNPNFINKEIVKHEFCHLKQAQTNRANGGCQGIDRFRRFLLESECYSAQQLPDDIYSRLYFDMEQINEAIESLS